MMPNKGRNRDEMELVELWLRQQYEFWKLADKTLNRSKRWSDVCQANQTKISEMLQAFQQCCYDQIIVWLGELKEELRYDPPFNQRWFRDRSLMTAELSILERNVIALCDRAKTRTLEKEEKNAKG